jgi:hypothetical protein
MAFTINDMAFKVDDLLINILPKREIKVEGLVLDLPEWLWCLEHLFCRACTLIRCLPTDPPPEEIAKAFAGLKQELKKQISERQAEMKEIEQDLLPQSVAQVDELRQKLHVALVALDKRRADLESQKG